MLELLSLVERWLESAELPCANVLYGGRSYMIRTSDPAGTRRGFLTGGRRNALTQVFSSLRQAVRSSAQQASQEQERPRLPHSRRGLSCVRRIGQLVVPTVERSPAGCGTIRM